jgi:hypothetical protein
MKGGGYPEGKFRVGADLHVFQPIFAPGVASCSRIPKEPLLRGIPPPRRRIGVSCALLTGEEFSGEGISHDTGTGNAYSLNLP